MCGAPAAAASLRATSARLMLAAAAAAAAAATAPVHHAPHARISHFVGEQRRLDVPRPAAQTMGGAKWVLGPKNRSLMLCSCIKSPVFLSDLAHLHAYNLVRRASSCACGDQRKGAVKARARKAGG